MLMAKNLLASAGDLRDVGSIPGSGRFPWRRAWQLTPVFLPGESHRQRSLAGYRHRVAKSDMTEATWHACPHYVCKAGGALNQGSPTPGPLTSTMVRNQPHSRMQVVGTRAKLLRLSLQSLPIARTTARARPAIRSAAALGSNRSVNPIVLLILKPSPQPSQSMEKSSCMKITGLWCQKGWGLLP